MDHPLRRIELAYVERFDDLPGVRYAFSAFADAMTEFELEPQEFEDAIELFVDDVLYDEDETALSCVLHALKVLTLKHGFPIERLPYIMDRLQELESFTYDNGLVCFFLTELYVAIWSRPVLGEPNVQRAYEAIVRLSSDKENVIKLKSVIKSLGLLMVFKEADDNKREQAFHLIRDTLEQNSDWRVYAYAAQTMRVAFSQGHIDGDAIGELIEWIGGFLEHEYEASLYVPVGECLLQVLQSCQLNDAQVQGCLKVMLYIVQHAEGMPAIRTLLRMMGLSLHWHYLSDENDALCLQIYQSVLANKHVQALGVELAGSIAEVFVNPPKVRESLRQGVWVDKLVEAIVVAQDESAFALIGRILDAPLVKDIFTEKHYDDLAKAIFVYLDACDPEAKPPLRVLGLVDVMLGLRCMPKKYLTKVWELMTAMLNKKMTKSASLGLWSVILEGLVSFVASPLLSASEREAYFDRLDALIQSRRDEPSWLQVFGRVYGILLGVEGGVCSSRIEQVLDRLLGFVGYEESEPVQALGWSGLEAAITAGFVTSSTAEFLADRVVHAFGCTSSDETRVNIVRVCALLKDGELLPKSAKDKLLRDLSDLRGTEGEWYFEKYMGVS